MFAQESLHQPRQPDEPRQPNELRQPGAAGDGPSSGTGAWTSSAREQLQAAIGIAARVPAGGSVAAALYQQWFAPTVGAADRLGRRRPLAGLYRAAHAANAVRVADGVAVLERHDVIGADGWWRTWGESWTPPRSRPGSVRVLLTPRAECRTEFVHLVTTTFASARHPWSLACAVEPRRARRYASAVLDLPTTQALSNTLLDELEELVHPVAPPLSLRVAPGVGLVAQPDNGMSFGEHRCHLIGLGIRRAGTKRHPLMSIADVFAAHGIDPGRPHGVGAADGD